MGKGFGLILMMIAMYVGMTIYAEGMDRAFGGIFAPLQSARSSDAPVGRHLTPLAQTGDDAATRPAQRVRITDAVRNRVTADLERAARRRGE